MRTLTLADPGPEDVLVDIAYATLCRFDLDDIDHVDAVPVVPGREAAGVVEAVGGLVRTVGPGDHVVISLPAFCGQCSRCLAGRFTLCRRHFPSEGTSNPVLTTTTGQPVRAAAGVGAFAEKVVMHHSALTPIPADVALAHARVLGCATLTGYGVVVHRARVRPGAVVAVIGAGRTGMSAIQAAHLSGAAVVIAVDVKQHQLTIAERIGATATIDATTTTDAVAEVLRMTGGGVDHAFETVGRIHTVEQAVAMLRPGATATVAGTVPTFPPIQIDGADFCHAEKCLQASFLHPSRFSVDIGTLLAAHAVGGVSYEHAMPTVLLLDDIDAGYAHLRDGGSLHAVVDVKARHGSNR